MYSVRCEDPAQDHASPSLPSHVSFRFWQGRAAASSTWQCRAVLVDGKPRSPAEGGYVAHLHSFAGSPTIILPAVEDAKDCR